MWWEFEVKFNYKRENFKEMLCGFSNDKLINSQEVAIAIPQFNFELLIFLILDMNVIFLSFKL